MASATRVKSDSGAIWGQEPDYYFEVIARTGVPLADLGRYSRACPGRVRATPGMEEDMSPVDLAREAAVELGIDPVSVPIRGGTDGSRLTEMGVPTPNLFTGMQNIHGPLEWISVQDMVKATDLCLTISRFASRSTK